MTMPDVKLAPRYPYESATEAQRQAMANAVWPHSVTVKMTCREKSSSEQEEDRNDANY